MRFKHVRTLRGTEVEDRPRHRSATAFIGVLAMAAMPALAIAGSPSAPDDARARPSELVANGGFERGTKGWQTNTRNQSLQTRRFNASGQASVILKASRRGTVALDDRVDTVRRTTAGKSYKVRAYVRSVGSDFNGVLRVREVADSGRVVGVGRTRFRAVRSGWTRVKVRYTTASRGASLDLGVIGRDVPVGDGLLVDDVSMKRRPGTTPPPDRPGCVSDPMGIPPAGTTYLGAAVSGTSGAVESREAQLGATLPLHRTYFRGDNVAGAVRQATEDLGKGRLPWISFKAPYSWAEMAAGAGDSWSTRLADGLATVRGPVWLAVHHEPQNDGEMADWTKMQQRIAPIIHARTDNVAYSIIHSGWNVFGGGNNEVAGTWPGDDNIDILAIDAYNDYGAIRNGNDGKTVLDLRTYYEKMAAWANAHGTAWAIGETGQTRLAADEDPTWLDRSYHAMQELGGAGLAYFDSSFNSVADWTLDDPIKFERFQGLLPESARLC